MSDLREVSGKVLKLLDSEPRLLTDWMNDLKQVRQDLRQALNQPDHRDKDIADLTKACQVLLRENLRLQEELNK